MSEESWKTHRKTSRIDLYFVKRVSQEMTRYFGEDARRIAHALRVAEYANKLLDTEQGDHSVVLTAAYLHDIGIKEAEKRHSSTAARYQHQEGPPITKKILISLEAGDDLVEEVCDIVGHHHKPRKQETINFKIVYDADLIVNLEDKKNELILSPSTIAKLVAKRFLTSGGRALGHKLFGEIYRVRPEQKHERG